MYIFLYMRLYISIWSVSKYIYVKKSGNKKEQREKRNVPLSKIAQRSSLILFNGNTNRYLNMVNVIFQQPLPFELTQISHPWKYHLILDVFMFTAVCGSSWSNIFHHIYRLISHWNTGWEREERSRETEKVKRENRKRDRWKKNRLKISRRTLPIPCCQPSIAFLGSAACVEGIGGMRVVLTCSKHNVQRDG